MFALFRETKIRLCTLLRISVIDDFLKMFFFSAELGFLTLLFFFSVLSCLIKYIFQIIGTIYHCHHSTAVYSKH